MKMYRNKKIIITFLAPTIIGLTLFVYYPLVKSILNSFYEWTLFSSDKKWIGLGNFIEIITGENIGLILKNNTLYAVISVICQVLIAMVLAACLEEAFMRKFQPFFRSILFMPSLISMTVVAILWKNIFNPNTGILNSLIHAIGFTDVTPQWIGDAHMAIFCCIFISQWQGMGYCILLDLIGIQKIPSALYDAAKIDGAGALKRFFYVTVPMAKESMLVTSLIIVIGSFKLFTEIQVLTGGGPGRATEVLATAMYRAAFTNDKMGIGSAYAVIIFVITMTLSLIQMKVSKTGKE